eukprot:c14219_g1_i1.p1 GENE.c14219_g1_i1~~c14219_g1_i1.p1  ORF type:complete len:544 (+),score=126.21 c14219_g1_i1:34-1665(+)
MLSSLVRVRYAPSPTGFTHLGGLRTALYNYLFSRSQPGGKFILRIEDTDQTRYKAGSVEEMISSLRWAGLTIDEGPGGIGGDYGPYVQSERLALYSQAAASLLKSRNAYRCFCSPERLADLKDSQRSSKDSFVYDRRCLSIHHDESEHRAAAGHQHTIRLLVPEGETEVSDLVRGKLTFNNSLLEDTVLMKSDGFPTYHLASVVDDHHMRISHVIRGEEWLSSLPKHKLIHTALFANNNAIASSTAVPDVNSHQPPPIFVHLPLLVNPDGSKLSKRQAHSSVGHYREMGYLPSALVNFVALMGWSPPPPNADQEIFWNMDELIAAFSLSRIHKSPSTVQPNKMVYFNAMHLRRLINPDKIPESSNGKPIHDTRGNAATTPTPATPNTKLLDHIRPFLPQYAFSKGEEHLVRVLSVVAERVSLVTDIPEVVRCFYCEPDASLVNAAVADWSGGVLNSVQLLPSALEHAAAERGIEALSWKEIQTELKRLSKENKISVGDLMKAIRQTITGHPAGCGLGELFELIGVTECSRRIRIATQSTTRPA